VGFGLVESLARPGGNATGFMSIELSMGVKWLELLKQIAPAVRRVAVLRDPTQGSGLSVFAAIQAVAPLLQVEVNPVGVRDDDEIERGINAFARGSNDGLIATIRHAGADSSGPDYRAGGQASAAGGLSLSKLRHPWGPDFLWSPIRPTSTGRPRVTSIGEKAGNLPVQAPVRYETVLNMKTAKALVLDVPPIVFARADEVIE
jgi:putative ABC transport system substrate-binding protein